MAMSQTSVRPLTVKASAAPWPRITYDDTVAGSLETACEYGSNAAMMPTAAAAKTTIFLFCIHHSKGTAINDVTMRHDPDCAPNKIEPQIRPHRQSSFRLQSQL